MAHVIPDFSSLPPSKNLQVERENLKVTAGVAFNLKSVLSPEECNLIVSRCTQPKISEEVRPQHYKLFNPPHGIVTHALEADLVRARFSTSLYNRIRPLLQTSDFATSPLYSSLFYEMNNKDNITWQPIGLHEIMVFVDNSKITEKSLISKPPRIFNCTVALTFAIYLNDDFVGNKPTLTYEQPILKSSSSAVATNLPCSTPKIGTAVVFSDTFSYSWWTKVEKGNKYMLRAELLLQCSVNFPPPRLVAFKNDSLKVQLAELMKLHKSDTADIATKFQKVQTHMKFRAKVVSSPEAGEKDVTSKIPADVYARVFGYLEASTLVVCSSVNRLWHKMAQQNPIWLHKFNSKFSKLFGMTDIDPTIDWYHEYKVASLAKAANFSWMCVDIGAFILKTIMTGKHRNFAVGKNTIPYTPNKLDCWDKTWELLTRMILRMIYDNQNPVVPSKYAVVISENHFKYDRALLNYLMFTIMQYPAYCVVNSAVLALYSEERTTGIVIEIGYYSTTVTPVWHGQVLTKSIKHYGAGGAHIEAFGEERGSIDETNLIFEDSRHMNELRVPSQHYPIPFESLYQCVLAALRDCDPDKQADLRDYIFFCGEIPNSEDFRIAIEVGFSSSIPEACFYCPPLPEFAVVRGASLFSESAKCIEMCETRVNYYLSSHASTSPVMAPANFF